MKNKEWMKYLSKKQISTLLEKCKTDPKLQYITDENMLAEWVFHWYDGCFCEYENPTEEEIQSYINQQYIEVLDL